MEDLLVAFERKELPVSVDQGPLNRGKSGHMGGQRNE
jgi:hypothetical protein